MKSSVAGVSPRERYDRFAQALHWIFAAGIAYATLVGYALHFIRNSSVYEFLSHLNMSLGTVLIVLFPIRVWWKFVRDEPAPPEGLRPEELQDARLVQKLIYVAIAAVLVSGYLMVPDGYRLFGLVDIPTPFAKGRITEALFVFHRFSTAALAVLVGLHVMGVLVHSLVHRVRVLWMML